MAFRFAHPLFYRLFSVNKVIDDKIGWHPLIVLYYELFDKLSTAM